MWLASSSPRRRATGPGEHRVTVVVHVSAALMIRDGMCHYPGCHSTRHLKAHHRVPWSASGRTDLDNLILLCQWHHTVVYEGGVSITAASDGWLVTKPDGQPCQPRVTDQQRTWHLDLGLRNQQQTRDDRLAGVDSFHHPEASIIRPPLGR
jgi:hypothetical protein